MYIYSFANLRSESRKFNTMKISCLKAEHLSANKTLIK